ncbi:MAG: hypothetical protein Fur0032_23600 [Terrimicrobiaceae bacterium]
MTKPPKAERGLGFTIVELLVVIAVMGLLVLLAAPALRGMISSQTVEAAGSAISSAMESARLEAISRKSPVWLGFASQTNAGRLELLVVPMLSKDGTADPRSDNLIPLARPARLTDIALTGFSELTPETRSLLNSQRSAVLSNLSSSTTGATISLGGVNYAKTITFSPRGEAMLSGSPSSTNGFDPLIAIGLRQSRGTTVPADAQELAVLLDGSIASPEILRVR